MSDLASGSLASESVAIDMPPNTETPRIEASQASSNHDGINEYVLQNLTTDVPHALEDPDREMECETEDGDHDGTTRIAREPFEGGLSVSYRIPVLPTAIESPIAGTPAKHMLSRGLSSQRCCRICLCEEGDTVRAKDENPLIAPCSCKGSVRFIHLECLRTWILGRLNIRREGDNVSFIWQTLECELCKEPYPATVTLDRNTKDERVIELFSIPKPDLPYILMEPKANPDSDGRNTIYVVSLANINAATLGRGHESHVRISDISVSRVHARLRFHYQPAPNSSIGARPSLTPCSVPHFSPDGSMPPPEGCFVLEDHRSKFGTLYELRDPLKIDTVGGQLSIQIGRTVLTFTLKKQWRSLLGCLKPTKKEEDVVVVDHVNPVSSQRRPSAPGSIRSSDHNASVQVLSAVGGGNENEELRGYRPPNSSSAAQAATQGRAGGCTPMPSVSRLVRSPSLDLPLLSNSNEEDNHVERAEDSPMSGIGNNTD
eukprot:GHVO01039783.1.p1 GENE.GHVO01039783.1~~GHVO01039783.1.p1  ORF type:complete len:561 (-),score=66.60 GHVO01039783.1:199-1659(-)